MQQGGPATQESQFRGPVIEADLKTLGGMLKEGESRGFIVRCDETERVGGTNTAPTPLQYFMLGVGF